MKRKILIPIILLLTTGCVYTKDASIEQIADTTINSKLNLSNHVNKGFKFYLPKGLSVKKVDARNEIIQSKINDYYLYVDLISYYNKTKLKFNKNGNYYNLELKDKGIINVNEYDNYYIVKIIYNYATIEVKCEKNNLKEVINYGLIITSSIKYNDDVIEKMLSDNNINSSEEQINLFDHETKDDSLDVDDTYVGDEETPYDPDVIN